MLSCRKAFRGALGLAAALLALPARAAEADRYVPADAEVVVHVNVKQILGSGLAKKYVLPQVKKALDDNKEARQFLAALGLDPLKDVSSVTVSSVANATQGRDKVVVVLRGNFDPAKVHKLAEKVAEDKKDELKIGKAGDKYLYETTQQGKTVYSGFPAAGTLVASPTKAYVVAALEGKTAKVSKALQEALAGADARQSVWVASVATDDIKKAAGKNQFTAGIAPKLKAFTGGITVGDDVAVSLKVQTTDPKAAQTLDDLVTQFVKPILGVAGQSNEDLAPLIKDVLDSMKVTTQKGDLDVKFKVSAATIDKAVKKFGK